MLVGVQIVALLLALGGTAWGVLLLIVLVGVGPSSPIFCLVVLPGYVVTFGYFIRTIWTPPFLLRCVIWTSSIFIQSAWLILVGLQELHLGTMWWLFATAASVWALRQEIAHEDLDAA
ncbi:MAG: hypothetical protein QM775_07290 [Pirellulales bacterium]